VQKEGQNGKWKERERELESYFAKGKHDHLYTNIESEAI